MKIQRLLSLALAALFLLSAQSPVFAQNAAADLERDLLADFPPLSIDSVERAEEAIKRLPPVREALSSRYMQEKADCLERFFVASCLSDLRSRERKASKAVNRIDVEAKAFLRRERAAERDRVVAERERRAEEEGGKSIPYSGAARSPGRNGQGNSEGRESSRRIHIERVPAPDSDTDTDTSPEAQAATPAESGELPGQNVAEPMPEPAMPPDADPDPEAVPATPDDEHVPTAPAPASPASPDPQSPGAQSSVPTGEDSSFADEAMRESEAQGEAVNDAQAPTAAPTEANPIEANPAQARPAEANSTEANSTEASPAEAAPEPATERDGPKTLEDEPSGSAAMPAER